MVNDAVTIVSGTDAIVSGAGERENPERRLAIGYARAELRAALSALFALDDALAGILRTTREPLVGQMRLTWWHDALTALDDAPAPAEPVLRALEAEVLPRGVSGARLAELIEAWEVLVDGQTLENAALSRFAAQRGALLFEMAGTMLNAPTSDPVAAAGQGWAIIDLARHIGDRTIAERAIALAQGPLRIATNARWSRNARALGALALLARMDASVPLHRSVPTGSPARVARLLLLRLTGR